MLVSPALELEAWRPDFSSSGQASPEWTRLCLGGEEVSNSLEGMEWDSNPVQVVVCEECGHSGCQSGNYVHVSATAGYVAWTAPQIDSGDEWEVAEYTPAPVVKSHGGLLLPRSLWDGWSASRPWFASSTDLPAINARAVLDAWWWSAPPPLSRAPLGSVAVLDAYVLGSTMAGTQETQDLITSLLASLSDADSGEFKESEAEVHTVYMEAGFEWPCFAEVGGRRVPVVAPGWVFEPSVRG